MSAVVTEPAQHQGRCERCGWHSHWVRSKETAEKFMRVHDAGNCPVPIPVRYGGFAECGCWCYVSPGTCAGTSRENCPRHGDVLIVECNKAEPEGEKMSMHWTVPR